MMPQPPEFFAHFSTLLRGLADSLSPLPAPPRAASVPVAQSVRPVRSRCHPVV